MKMLLPISRVGAYSARRWTWSHSGLTTRLCGSVRLSTINGPLQDRKPGQRLLSSLSFSDPMHVLRARHQSTATKAMITINPQNAKYSTDAVQHTGEPKGRNITIAGVETYLAEPPSGTLGPKKVILFFPDVFGPFFINAQLLQDYFASQGFYVLGLDYFFSDPIQRHSKEHNFDRDAWFRKSREISEKAIPKWVEGVRKKYGVDAKFCAVGYCYGGPYALQAATTNDIVAAAFAHPTALSEDHFRNLKQPLLLSCAENDDTFPADKRRQSEDNLREIKATYLVQVYSGVSHGFATRGDPAVENSRWAKEHCAKSVVEWFKRFT